MRRFVARAPAKLTEHAGRRFELKERLWACAELWWPALSARTTAAFQKLNHMQIDARTLLIIKVYKFYCIYRIALACKRQRSRRFGYCQADLKNNQA
jgi:hypothetical protein